MDFFTNIIEQAKDTNIILQFLSVLIVGAVPFLEGYVAAPLGIAIGFPIVLTIIAAIIGNWLSVAAVIIAGDRLQNWRRKSQEQEPGKRMQRAKTLFEKYGVIGVALIGPLLVGNHIGAFISIAAGASRQRVLLWQTVSIVLWTIGAGLVIVFGSGLLR